MRIIIKVGHLDTITLWRVRKQIQDTAPKWVEFVSDEYKADAQIVLAIGRSEAEFVRAIPTILLQLCYKTAHGGSKEFWDEVWADCLMVGSYFDLDAPNFVRFPMGYDPKMFYRDDSVRTKYDAIVFGDMDGPEEIKSVVEAFDYVAHISGTDMGFGLGYVNYNNVPDDRLRSIYQRSKYCIGLRRDEGFEMPIVEGAACGCVPITFNLDCYKHWFDEFAVFINPEADTKSMLKVIGETGSCSVPDMSKVKAFEQQNAWKPFWHKLEEVSNG